MERMRQRLPRRNPAAKHRGAEIWRVVNVKFSESSLKTLERLASKRKTTMGQVLADAIALERWADDTEERGERIVSVRDGKAYEMVR